MEIPSRITKEAVIKKTLKDQETELCYANELKTEETNWRAYDKLEKLLKKIKEIKTVEDMLCSNTPLFSTPFRHTSKRIRNYGNVWSVRVIYCLPSDNRLVIGLISLDDISTVNGA